MINSKKAVGILGLILIFAQNSFAVLPPSHYKKLQENSHIKAIARITSIEVLEQTKQHTLKKATFTLEKAFKLDVPNEFTATYYAVDSNIQDPGVGGTLYYYPREQQRVYVTISENDGWITSLVDLEQAKQKTISITDRHYQYSIKGNVVGNFYVQGLFQLNETIPFLFKHQFYIDHKGERMSLEMETACLDNSFYSPRNIISKGQGSEVSTFSARFIAKDDGGQFLIDTVSGQSTLNTPSNSVTKFMMFELVQDLPFYQGNKFKFTTLDEIEMKVRSNDSIRYLGQDNTIIAGRAGLHHFTERGEGHSPVHYWLDDNHQLLRVVWDNKKELLLQ